MEMSKLILKIIKDIKGDADVTMDENLRDMGINSIQFVQIIVNLETELQIEIPDEFLMNKDDMTVNTLVDIMHAVMNKLTEEST